MLLPLLLLAPPAQACKCAASFSACNGVGRSGLVFIGTVESIDPPFLSRWDESSRASMPELNKAFTDALESPSASAIKVLKGALLKVHPSLPANEKLRLESAKTALEVAALFNSEMSQGMRVRFKVKTLFKYEDDDGDAKEDTDSFDIWTPFGDCGVEFQTGETYLVYADEDEGSGALITGKCTRTKRLSDAAEDLAYLFFYKENRKESSRLEGFATTDRLNLLDFSELPETVQSPVAGVIVELKSTSFTRYTETDRKGKFLFDGLPEADYKISAFAGGYLLDRKPETGPLTLHIKENSCAHQLLLLPKKEGK